MITLVQEVKAPPRIGGVITGAHIHLYCPNSSPGVIRRSCDMVRWTELIFERKIEVGLMRSTCVAWNYVSSGCYLCVSRRMVGDWTYSIERNCHLKFLSSFPISEPWAKSKSVNADFRATCTGFLPSSSGFVFVTASIDSEANVVVLFRKARHTSSPLSSRRY